jgi:CrcB protein
MVIFRTLTGPDGRMFVGTTARQFVMVGICGGYTTFLSFSLQTLNLMNDGEMASGRHQYRALDCPVSCCGMGWTQHRPVPTRSKNRLAFRLS